MTFIRYASVCVLNCVLLEVALDVPSDVPLVLHAAPILVSVSSPRCSGPATDLPATLLLQKEKIITLNVSQRKHNIINSVHV